MATDTVADAAAAAVGGCAGGAVAADGGGGGAAAAAASDGVVADLLSNELAGFSPQAPPATEAVMLDSETTVAPCIGPIRGRFAFGGPRLDRGTSPCLQATELLGLLVVPMTLAP